MSYFHVKLKCELVTKRNKNVMNSNLVYKHKCNKLIEGRFFSFTKKKNQSNNKNPPQFLS